ncbi:twin-arginine translocase TatA/TatE family subunit [Methylobacterium sp. J-077]|uniref:twin-arginine translocase TatA/TatE family subunit n=1 Tax=Methylobacterium sp. J-077 TaxID=2836656 RepID=UPI001FBB5E8B|nr:twin-arginine translocase TatA/TatE family subunit [Methylobacterium sp. J-077]MCJ2122014.1 twin-arginine translocase TatA/TatE family subunit [Methylobacterium sp. J-077]
MGSMSIWHWVIVAVIVMLLFGRGKVSDLMGDVAKGIKAFKKGMAEDETPPASQPVPPPSEPVRTLPHTAETSPGTAIPASHLPGGERKPV